MEKNINETTEKIYSWFDEHNLYDPVVQFAKLNEEVGEIAHELTRNRYKSAEMRDAIGDTYITLVGMAHHLQFDISECIDIAYNEIKDRKGKTVNGTFIKDTRPKGTPTEKLIQNAGTLIKKSNKAIKVLEKLKDNYNRNGSVMWEDIDKETTDFLTIIGLWDNI